MNMFNDVKIPSRRILLTNEFVSFLSTQYPSLLERWMISFNSERCSFGLELHRMSKQEEELLGSLLLDFLSKYEK